MNKKTTPTKPAPHPRPQLEKIIIGGATYETRLTGKFRNRTTWRKPDKNKVESVIPGTIQKILVQVGQEVEYGEPLLILEAMKMRNEVRAPVSGKVYRIHVREGEHVPKAHLLVQLR
jgi:biotin carboxyl carrier protein